MHFLTKLRVLSLSLVILPGSQSNSKFSNNFIPSASGGNLNAQFFPKNDETLPSNFPHQISNSIGVRSGDKIGNVIFNEIPFSDFRNGDKTLTDTTQHQFSGKGQKKRHDPISIAGGNFLENHRLEGPLSPEVALSSPATGASLSQIVSLPSNFHESGAKLLADNSQIHTTASLGGSVTAAGAAAAVIPAQGRTFPEHHLFGSHHHHNQGWASNSGNCLFSCSNGGGFGGAVSCCQQNYVQCCPNAHQEQWNFKNLHHGRGYGLPGVGNFKGSHAWGAGPIAQPVIRPHPHPLPNPCQPGPYPPPVIPPIGIHKGGGGSIFNKGIETIKHNFHHIGQLFKEHIPTPGWSGGNAAGGYYFHRRSDEETDEPKSYTDVISSRKRRPTRSLHNGNGWGQVVPCPVYSTPPHLGWQSARPYSVGLGSLIGWTRPVNSIHSGIVAGGYGHGGIPHQYAPGVGYGGWGSGGCRWDYQCPGAQQCCKGICQLAPYG